VGLLSVFGFFYFLMTENRYQIGYRSTCAFMQSVHSGLGNSPYSAPLLLKRWQPSTHAPGVSVLLAAFAVVTKDAYCRGHPPEHRRGLLKIIFSSSVLVRPEQALCLRQPRERESLTRTYAFGKSAKSYLLLSLLFCRDQAYR
jgi:hypothetical protein